MAGVHVRKQIRDYVAAGLAGLPTTGDRVKVGRVRPLGAGHDPMLLIYTREETSSRAVAGRPPGLERPVTLHIEGRTVTPNEADDLLDQIAAEVEAAISALIDYGRGIFFGGMVQNVELTSTVSGAKGEGENIVSFIVLSYRITYCTVEGEPTAVAVTQDV